MPTPPKSPPSKIIEGHDDAKPHGHAETPPAAEQEDRARGQSKGRPPQTTR